MVTTTFGSAARKSVLPAWLAVIVQLPIAVSVSVGAEVVPDTEQFPAAANATGSPDVAQCRPERPAGSRTSGRPGRRS